MNAHRDGILFKLMFIASALVVLTGYFTGQTWISWFGAPVLAWAALLEIESMLPIPWLPVVEVIIAKQFVDTWWQAAYVGYAVGLVFWQCIALVFVQLKYRPITLAWIKRKLKPRSSMIDDEFLEELLDE